MVKVIYFYDVVPGKAEEAREWARKRWIPFWEKQPAVRGYEVFTNFFGARGGVPLGSPQRMVSFDVEDVSSLDSLFATPEFLELSRELQGFAINLHFLLFRRSYPG